MDFDQQQRDLYTPIICVHTCIVVHTYIRHFLGIENEWRKNLNKSTIALQKVYPENMVLKYSIQTLSDAPHVAVCDDRARRPRLYLFSCAHLSKVCKLVWCCTIVSVSNRFLRADEVLADGFFRVAAGVWPANFFTGGGVISGEVIVSHWIRENRTKKSLGISVFSPLWLREPSHEYSFTWVWLNFFEPAQTTVLLREPSCKINKPARTTVWLRERSLQDSFSWVWVVQHLQTSLYHCLTEGTKPG